MGAESCEKSLETFALDHNPAIWSKSLQTFLATEVARKVARRKLYRFGCPCYCQILVDCSLGSHNPIHKHTRVRAPHRRTPHETWRASTTSQKRLLSQQQLQQLRSWWAWSSKKTLTRKIAPVHTQRRRRNPRQSSDGGPIPGQGTWNRSGDSS